MPPSASAAALVISVFDLSARMSAAALVAYDFTVTAVNGPCAGTGTSGYVAFDEPGAPAGVTTLCDDRLRHGKATSPLQIQTVPEPGTLPLLSACAGNFDCLSRPDTDGLPVMGERQ